MFVLLILGCASEPSAVAPVLAPVAGDARQQAHAGGGGHMALMAATRDRLRTELGDAYDAPVAGFDGADAGRGREVYDQVCTSCHGAAGKGDGPSAVGLDPLPADFTDTFHARYYSDAGRVRIIESGSPGTAMAAFAGQLEPQQIFDVYAYVASLRGGSPPAAAPDHGAHH